MTSALSEPGERLAACGAAPSCARRPQSMTTPGSSASACETQSGMTMSWPKCTSARTVGQVDRAGRRRGCRAAGRGARAGRQSVETKLGIPSRLQQQRVDRSRRRRRRRGRQRWRAASGQPSLTQSTPSERRGEAAHRADGEVDLAEQQHADDAERDDADRRAVEQQVHQVVRRQEDRVQAVEDRPDDDEADDDRQRAEIAGADAVEESRERRRRRPRRA